MTDIFGTLEIRKLPERKWQLLSSPLYVLNSGKTIKPTPPFVYDGGSVPQAFWSIVGGPVGTDADMGYLPHDWLYSRSRVGDTTFSREEADEAMLEIHLYCGVDPVVAYGVYSAVRGAGWRAWGDGTRDIPDVMDDPPGTEWFRE